MCRQSQPSTPLQGSPRSGSLRSPPRGLPCRCLNRVKQRAATKEKVAVYPALSLVTNWNEATGGENLNVVDGWG